MRAGRCVVPPCKSESGPTDQGEAMTAPPERRLRLGPLRRPAGPPGRLRRRVGVAVRLLGALIIVGGLYTAFVPRTPALADDDAGLSASAASGKQLFETTCITCHGRN